MAFKYRTVYEKAKLIWSKVLEGNNMQDFLK